MVEIVRIVIRFSRYTQFYGNNNNITIGQRISTRVRTSI